MKTTECCVCGADLGYETDTYYRDTCGDLACERELREQEQAYLDEAYEELDRTMGRGW